MTTPIYSVFCNQCCASKDIYLNRSQAELKCAEMNLQEKQRLFIENNKDLVISKLSQSPIALLIQPFLRAEMESFVYNPRYIIIENKMMQ